jgi:hypothetical protein
MTKQAKVNRPTHRAGAVATPEQRLALKKYMFGKSEEACMASLGSQPATLYKIRDGLGVKPGVLARVIERLAEEETRVARRNSEASGHRPEVGMLTHGGPMPASRGRGLLVSGQR